MENRGVFIVFEGLDGVGKTTHVRELSRRLNEAGFGNSFSLSMPDRNEPETGILIDKYLKKQIELDDMQIHNLYAQNRAILLRDTILPAIYRGENVVCDRYAFSGISYSAAKGKEDLTPSLALWADKDVPLPDILVFLTKQGDALQNIQRDQEVERYETSSFQSRVAVQLCSLVDSLRRSVEAGVAHTIIVNIQQKDTVEETAQAIFDTVRNVIGQRRSFVSLEQGILPFIVD